MTSRSGGPALGRHGRAVAAALAFAVVVAGCGGDPDPREELADAVRATADSTLQLIDQLQGIERKLKEAASSALPSGGNPAVVETLMLHITVVF